MYFRHKHNKSGRVLQLHESYRNGEGQPRQRLVVSLGDAALPEGSWKAVAKAVEGQLYGVRELLPQRYSRSEQGWIDYVMRRVEARGRWQPLVHKQGKSEEAAKTIVDAVVLEEVNHQNTALLGPVLAGLHAWRELQMPECLRAAGLSGAQVEAATASVLNRLVDPLSENALGEWVGRTALGDLLGGPRLAGKRDRYYRVSDRLLENQEAIEEHLRRRHGELFNLDTTIILYDLTNTHFEGLYAGNAQTRRGKNKQKRDDCLQIVIAMAFNREGFELAHRIFEGNRVDNTTLVDMIEQLQQAAGGNGRGASKAVVIVDAGIATQENLELLRRHNFHYLVNDTRRQRGKYREHFLQEKAFTSLPRARGEPEVQVCLIEDPEPDGAPAGAPQSEPAPRDRLVLCKSAGRREKETAIVSKAEARFVQQLRALQEAVAAGRRKDPEKIERAVGRIQARHRRVQRFYRIELKHEKDGSRPQLHYSRCEEPYRQNEQLHGCYVLRTDLRELEAPELWRLYMTLTRAEDGFRALKSDLGLRPNRHHIEPRINAHVFISVLAYHLLRFIEYKLQVHGDRRSWQSVKRLLQTHAYVTVVIPTAQGAVYRLRQPGLAEKSQQDIYRKLGVAWKNLPASRTRLKAKTPATL